MEFSSYLQAIQKVAGQKPGEKYQTLNRTARRIIAESKDSNSIKVQSSEELPDALMPLVQLEIARILKKPEGIVDALKSDDQIVFHRALKVRWFFDGSTPNYPNVYNFQNHILPYISLNNRTKLIKVFSLYLTVKQLAIAEEFYLDLSKMYGDKQAQPLLKACSEPFIWDTIVNRQIVLNINEVKILFLKYPNLIIKYLNLGKPSKDPYARNLHVINLSKYQEFLPTLLKKYSKTFVDLINTSQSTFDIELNCNLTDVLLKNETNELLNNPELYLPMLSLKKVTEKLSRSQFGTVLRAFYQSNIEDFNFEYISKYLKYIPNEEKMSLVLPLYEEVYKKSLRDCPDMITPDTIILFPQAEIIKQARKKLETDKDWHCDDRWACEKSWRCYLPVEESIPAVKEQILKCEEVSDRLCLMKQLIYTCKINDDKNALLEVLKYVTTRHRNEQGWSLIELLDELLFHFEIQYLSVEHWDVLWSFVKLLHVKNILKLQFCAAKKIMVAGIHFDLLNDRSITEKINLYTELNIAAWSPCWNIIMETPIYERQCLEEFSKSIPRIYPKLENTQYRPSMDVIYNYLKALYYFNTRNEISKNKLQNLSIKNYPWFLDTLKKIVRNHSEKQSRKFKYLKSLLKAKERDLYDLWVNELPALELNEMLIMLKYNPQKIIDHLEVFYKKCKDNIYHKCTRRILKSSRWCQYLPTKLVEMCVKDVEENKESRAIIVLSTLLEGPAFEKYVTLLARKTSTIIVEDDDDAKKEHMLELAIPASINVINPPMSLDFILQFCEGDYIHVISRCLVNVGRRTPVDNFLPFYQELMSRNVAVKKYGIKLFREIATTQQLRSTLINLWREEKHRSIRLLIVENILDAFMSQPSTETWEMIKECIDGLTIDDREALELIDKIDRVPNEYIADYVKKLLMVFKKIGNTDKTLKSQSDWYHTEKLLQNLPINVTVFFPEEFHEEILKTYLADLSLTRKIVSAAQRYLVDCYISPSKEKLDSRLQFFSDIFIRIIKNNTDASSDDKNAYSLSNFVYKLMQNILFSMENSADKTKFIKVALESFLSVSEPLFVPEFYCCLSFGALYNGKMSPKDYAAEINKILPSLVDIFTVGFISALAKLLNDLIRFFYGDTKNDAMLDMIECLLELDNDNAMFLGANLLIYGRDLKCKRFWKIITKLREQNHPLVISSIYMAINSLSA